MSGRGSSVFMIFTAIGGVSKPKISSSFWLNICFSIRYHYLFFIVNSNI